MTSLHHAFLATYETRYLVANAATFGDRGRCYLDGGGQHPTAFKTIKNARAAAEYDSPTTSWKTKRATVGTILLLDLTLLPIVDVTDIGPPARDPTDYEVAERQMEMWTLRAHRLSRSP